MTTWPGTLPDPMIADYSAVDAPRQISTPMEKGPQRRARITSHWMTSGSLSIVLVGGQADTFRTMLADANNGTDWVDDVPLDIGLGRALHRARFGAPRWQLAQLTPSNQWRVTIPYEVDEGLSGTPVVPPAPSAPTLNPVPDITVPEDVLPQDYNMFAYLVSPGTGTGLTWSLTGNPAGVTITAGGVMTVAAGTAIATHSMTLVVTTSDGSDNETFDLIVQTAAVLTAPTLSPVSDITVNETVLPQDYDMSVYLLDAGTGAGPIAWSVTSEPAGVTINSSTGLMTVAAGTAVGTDSMNLVATNGAGSDSEPFDLIVQAELLIPPTLNVVADITVNESVLPQDYDMSIYLASPGSGTGLTWSLTGNPAGVTITAGGLMTVAAGTAVNTHGMSLVVTTSQGSANESFNLIVEAEVLTPPVLNPVSNITANESELSNDYAMSVYLASVGSGTGLTWSLTGNPAGVTINSISGVMTVALGTAVAAHSISLVVTTSDGSDSEAFTLTVEAFVAAGPILSPVSDITVDDVSLPENYVMSNYLASAGTGTGLTWSLTGNPVGVTINSSTGLMTVSDVTAIDTHSMTLVVTTSEGSDSEAFDLVVQQEGGDLAHTTIYVTTVSPNYVFNIQFFSGFNYLTTIGWGDGDVDVITDWDDPLLTHTYDEPGNYILIIAGLCESFRITESTQMDVQIFGTSGLWTSTENMFKDCDNMTFSAGPNIDTSLVTNMNGMFWGCVDGNPDVSGFNTGNVQTFENMFFNTDIAVPDVSGFNMGSCLSIRGMFNLALIAEPDVSQWSMGTCQDFSFAFSDAAIADPDVSSWDMSSATTIESMFNSALTANPDVSAWVITSALLSMENAFLGCVITSPDVSSWDTSNVTTMEGLCRFAPNANLDVGAWNIGSLVTALNMFQSSALTGTNYDSLLIGWAAQDPNILADGFLHGGNATYTAGAAKAVLTGHNWTITDGGT